MEVMEGGDSAPKRMTIVKSHDVIKIVRYLSYPYDYHYILVLTIKPST